MHHRIDNHIGLHPEEQLVMLESRTARHIEISPDTQGLLLVLRHEQGRVVGQAKHQHLIALCHNYRVIVFTFDHFDRLAHIDQRIVLVALSMYNGLGASFAQCEQSAVCCEYHDVERSGSQRLNVLTLLQRQRNVERVARR